MNQWEVEALSVGKTREEKSRDFRYFSSIKSVKNGALIIATTVRSAELTLTHFKLTSPLPSLPCKFHSTENLSACLSRDTALTYKLLQLEWESSSTLCEFAVDPEWQIPSGFSPGSSCLLQKRQYRLSQ